MSQDCVQSQPKAKKPRKLNSHQRIIERFVTVEFSSQAKGFWPNEMRIAGQLIKQYGIDFLLQCPKPNDYRVTSLVWFLTPQGKRFLSDQKFEASKVALGVPKVQQFALESNNIDNNVVISSAPKTLKDFLNYGKTINTNSPESPIANPSVSGSQ